MVYNLPCGPLIFRFFTTEIYKTQFEKLSITTISTFTPVSDLVQVDQVYIGGLHARRRQRRRKEKNTGRARSSDALHGAVDVGNNTEQGINVLVVSDSHCNVRHRTIPHL